MQPGLSAYKEQLISKVAQGFDHRTESVKEIADLPWEMIPIVGSQMVFKEIIPGWMKSGRPFVYWDRGYLNRGGITWIKRNGPEYFRWQLNAWQMKRVRHIESDQRFRSLCLHVRPWRKGGKHIVIAAPSQHYAELHGIQDWTESARQKLRGCGRKISVRHKFSKVPLQNDLVDAHCLVTHGSVAAIEAAVLGIPVIVDPVSAAAPIGRTSINDIENLATPDRTMWLRSLALSQFTLNEIVNGYIWKELH